MSNQENKLRKYGVWRKLAAMMLFFCCTFLFYGSARAEEIFTDQMTVYMDDTSGAALPPARESQLATMTVDHSWSFKSQLTNRELEIYEALENAGDWNTIEAGQKIIVNLSTDIVLKIDEQYADNYQQAPEYQKFMGEINASLVRAANAFQKDYGEYYWLYGLSYIWNGTWNKKDTLTITSATISFSDYYADIRSEFGITREALAEIYSRTSGSSRYEKVKSIHDNVANLIIYPSGDLTVLYYHTITGGLLDKYNHYAVCECYAKLFRILCQKAGIPCILVTGGSQKDSTGAVIANHMWNYVQMDDGRWYLVDATWDDQESRIETNYFLAGKKSQGFNGKTVEQDHLPVGCYSSKTVYDPFTMPALSENSYLENNPDQVSSTPAITKISLSQTELNLTCYERENLVAVLEPADASSGELEWTVSNPGAVMVLRTNPTATVIARKVGNSALSTVITVCDKNHPEIKASCRVTVKHNFVDSVVTKEPSCTEAGTLKATCSGCGASGTAKVEPLGHEYEWQVEKEPSVHEEGLEVQICKRCGARGESQSIPMQIVTGIALDQEALSLTCSDIAQLTAMLQPENLRGYVLEWESSDTDVVTVTGEGDKAALKAVKAGEATITVKESGYPEVTASCVVTVGHKEEHVTEVTQQPTCTKQGVEAIKCAGCGEVLETKELETIEHNPGDWEVTEQPTLDTKGVKVRKCTMCGQEIEKDEIPAQTLETILLDKASLELECAGRAELAATFLPQDLRGYELHWESSDTDVVMVTAKEDSAEAVLEAGRAGTATISVTEKHNENTSALCTITVTHNYVDVETSLKKPTCTEDGEVQKTCTGCGDMITETISATGHTPGEWKEEIAATVDKEGVERRVCSVCGEWLDESKPIPKLQPVTEPESENPGGTDTPEPEKPGETQKDPSGTQKETEASQTETNSPTIQPEPEQPADPPKQPEKEPADPGTQKKPNKKAGVKWSVSSLPMQKGTTYSAAKLLQFAKGDSAASWTSSNKNVVAVSKAGKLTAKKKGSSTITVKTKNGAKASCKVTVQSGKVKTKKLTLSKKSAVLKRGKTLKLSVTRNPVTANDKLIYKSSNVKVAAVNAKGKITAKKKGTATITVKTQYGKTAKIKITVK